MIPGQLFRIGRKRALSLSCMYPEDSRRTVRATDKPELLRCGDPDESHEPLQVVAIGAVGVGIAGVGESLGRHQHLSELVELRSRKCERSRVLVWLARCYRASKQVPEPCYEHSPN